VYPGFVIAAGVASPADDIPWLLAFAFGHNQAEGHGAVRVGVLGVALVLNTDLGHGAPATQRP
jgi:hypothetical protein